MKALSLYAALIAGLLCSQASQALEVVVSIKPLKLIVQEITRGITEPQQLLAVGASPHDYQLRPSDVQRLHRADLVFWVGPALELFLQKPLSNLSANTRIVTLQARSSATTADISHEPPRGDGDTHDHDHDHATSEDPHLWLSPVAAITLAEQVSSALQQADPANQAGYAKNLAHFRQQQHRRDQAIAAQLAPVAEQGYFVFHDGYGLFEQRYRLNHLGAFTLSPDRRPGARQLAELRQMLEARQAVCVFSEPQFQPRLIEALTEGLEVRRGELDPMGETAESYDAFITQLADRFYRCLSGR